MMLSSLCNFLKCSEDRKSHSNTKWDTRIKCVLLMYLMEDNKYCYSFIFSAECFFGV
jgi:hypothetical protein